MIRKLYPDGKTKAFNISYDDGVIQDTRFVELLNRYGIPCTFNLNSGLEDFVWYYEDRHPIRRQQLRETVDMYRGHEIASHTLSHPLLTALAPPALTREVGEDCAALKEIFGLEDIGFGVPFTACGEREIRLIRKFVRYIRLSAFSDSFALPEDPYHIPIHGLYNDPDIYNRIYDFSRSTLPVALFVMAGHSYELEMLNHWDYMDKLLGYIRSFHFECMTTMEFVNSFYPKR
jgi:peptidoglycan/xylan/chitin deacetylase (PgdA/CDA1 family)